jgi:hypothetical protein
LTRKHPPLQEDHTVAQGHIILQGRRIVKGFCDPLREKMLGVRDDLRPDRGIWRHYSRVL